MCKEKLTVSHHRVKIKHHGERAEIPAAMVSAICSCRLPDFKGQHANCVEGIPYITANIVVRLLKAVRWDAIVITYYSTGTTLNIKIDYDQPSKKNPKSTKHESDTWLITAEYHGEDAGKIQGVFVRVHDADPDTSRGTETSVQR